MRGLFLILISFLLLNCGKDHDYLISKKPDTVEEKSQTNEDDSILDYILQNLQDFKNFIKEEKPQTKEEKPEFDPSEFSGP